MFHARRKRLSMMNSNGTIPSPVKSGARSRPGTSSPYLLNVKAKSGSLPFPAFFVGNRLKIPRIPFLRYLGYIN